MNAYRKSCAEVVERELQIWRDEQRFMQQQAKRYADWERRQTEATRITEPVPTEAQPVSRPGWRTIVRAAFKRLWVNVKGKLLWWLLRPRAN
jgi:hypothetical protein